MSDPLVSDPLATALTHHRSGRLREAERGYRRILEERPNDPDALHLLGVIAHQTGNHQAAADLIRRAVAGRNDNADYHTNLGLALNALDRHQQAADAFARAIELRPDSANAVMSYGAALQNLGELDAAVEQYQQAIRLAPRHATAHYNLGTAYKEQGRLAETIGAYRQALELTPEDVAIRANLAGALIETGDLIQARLECEHCLQTQPGNRIALAYRAVVAQRLDDKDTLRQLLDFDAFIHSVRVANPPGYDSLTSFNAALSTHVSTHPSLQYQPKLQATRNGTHTGELLCEPKGPVAGLEALVVEAIKAYVAGLPPAKKSHPFYANMPADFRLTMWAVVMAKQGHQLPHIHGDGYISGVYYPQLPRAVFNGAAGNAGWIEFGRAPDQFACRDESWLRLIQPEEGLMVLFPSYFYHRTIPFDTPEQRISIAFDAVPRA